MAWAHDTSALVKVFEVHWLKFGGISVHTSADAAVKAINKVYPKLHYLSHPSGIGMLFYDHNFEAVAEVKIPTMRALLRLWLRRLIRRRRNGLNASD